MDKRVVELNEEIEMVRREIKIKRDDLVKLETKLIGAKLEKERIEKDKELKQSRLVVKTPIPEKRLTEEYMAAAFPTQGVEPPLFAFYERKVEVSSIPDFTTYERKVKVSSIPEETEKLLNKMSDEALDRYMKSRTGSK